MKSIQITTYSADPENYSDLLVLKSAAGYYVGTLYAPEGQPAEPGSRDTAYFPTEEDAKYALQTLQYLDAASTLLRLQGTRKKAYITDRYQRIMGWVFGDTDNPGYRMVP